jgi:hypothetical protein
MKRYKIFNLDNELDNPYNFSVLVGYELFDVSIKLFLDNSQMGFLHAFRYNNKYLWFDTDRIMNEII